MPLIIRNPWSSARCIRPSHTDASTGKFQIRKVAGELSEVHGRIPDRRRHVHTRRRHHDLAVARDEPSLHFLVQTFGGAPRGDAVAIFRGHQGRQPTPQPCMAAAFIEVTLYTTPIGTIEVLEQSRITIMPRRIRVLERIAAGIHVPIVIEDLPRIRHQRIRREELAKRGVVGPDVTDEA